MFFRKLHDSFLFAKYDVGLTKTNFQEDKEKMTDQIQQLESENLNLKPWHLIGEVQARLCPMHGKRWERS